jgi:hypothetical protein
MPIYLGDQQIRKQYIDSYELGKIYLGNTLVQEGSTDILAFYNTANVNSYPGSGSTVFDLSGNENHLTITGSVTYLAESSSLLISSSANNYSDFGSLSTPVSFNGGNLNGTGSEFTIITFLQSYDGGDYIANWYLGGASASGNDKQILNTNSDTFNLYQIGVGANLGNPIGGTSFLTYQTSAPESQWLWGKSSSGEGYRKWSMVAYNKSSQASTNNLRIDARGYVPGGGGTYNQSALNSITLNNPSFPKIEGTQNNIFPATTYETNLDTTRLFVGKNPTTPANPQGTVPRFLFGGMIIFNRVLSTSEVNNYWNYFNIGR